jgi:hypothetical protein
VLKISRTEILDEYILIVFEGTMDLSRAISFIEPAYKICSENKKAKLLVDVSSVEGDFSTTMRFEYFTKLADANVQLKLKYGISVKTAYYGKIPLVDPDRFGKMVAVNRGINTNVFTDYREALDWLISEEDKKLY